VSDYLPPGHSSGRKRPRTRTPGRPSRTAASWPRPGGGGFAPRHVEPGRNSRIMASAFSSGEFLAACVRNDEFDVSMVLGPRRRRCRKRDRRTGCPRVLRVEERRGPQQVPDHASPRGERGGPVLITPLRLSERPGGAPLGGGAGRRLLGTAGISALARQARIAARSGRRPGGSARGGRGGGRAGGMGPLEERCICGPAPSGGCSKA
jgi:hypothetical protein